MFVFLSRGGEPNILALPTRVKMWLYTYSFIENAESSLQSRFGQLPVDETGQSESKSQTVLISTTIGISLGWSSTWSPN